MKHMTLYNEGSCTSTSHQIVVCNIIILHTTVEASINSIIILLWWPRTLSWRSKPRGPRPAAWAVRHAVSLYVHMQC